MRHLGILALLPLFALGSGQTVHPQLKFPKGKVERMTTRSNTTQTLYPGPGQKMSMTMENTMSMLMRVLGSGPRGATVQMTYESVKAKSTSNGQAMPPPTTDLEKFVKGKSIKLNFAPNGKVQSITGIKEILAKSMSTIPPELQQAMKQVFSEKSVRDMWSMSLDMVPNRPLKVGESWSQNMSLGQAPMAFGLNLKMKLEGVESRGGHRVARIGISGTGNLKMDGLGAQNVKITTNRFVISGKNFFDLDRGWLTEQNLKMQIDANASTSGQSVKMSVTQTSTTKVVAVK